MVDISGLNIQELVELKNNVEAVLLEKTKEANSFYEKVAGLKAKLAVFMGKSISLIVDGEDICAEFHFGKGVKFIIDTFD